MKLSILIPVLNEEATLGEIIEQVQRVPYEKELVIVDDGSTDATPTQLAELEKRYDNIRVFRHETNMGKGAALATALKHFEGDVVLIQDADLEYSPDDYPALLRPIEEGHADVVYGSRFLGGSYGRVHLYHHYLGNRLLTLFSNLVTNLNLTDMETCYKAFRADIARRLDLQSKGFAVEPEITCKVAKMKARIYEVPVRYAGRDYSAGKKIRPRDGLYAIWALLRWGLLG
ncbi:MAG: glycosyl transferase [Planctomycetes bacterium]|jgi:glycosyltransferase involved in cell wall biosynthesis|nr:glycosyl transferase [Planctomycetota bacterium]